MQLYVSNTNLLELFRLKSAVENVYINDADVTVTITDLDGAEVMVDGVPNPWPQDLEYVVGSSGDYRAVLSENLVLTPNQSYIAVIDANAGVNRFGHWEIKFTAKTRNL